ncbi:L-xylulose reductase-like protein, partial [Leptotrombidium deliense]
SKAAIREHLVYGATKAAVDQITRISALELGQHQIRVNAVNPTVVWTDLGKMVWSDPAKSQPLIDRIPLHRFNEVKDVVNTIVYLLSDKADMITGACIPVDGGYTAC